MFETILWAKAIEKGVEGADKISLASVEAVLKNLDRLANIGMWSIGIILLIAALFVGYNIYSSGRPIRRLRKEFQKEITRARKELVDHISVLNSIQAANIERTRAGVMSLAKKFDVSALLWSSAIRIFINARAKAGGEVIEKIDSFIDETFLSVEASLKSCKDKKMKPDIEQIKEYISQTPEKLAARKENIEKILGEF